MHRSLVRAAALLQGWPLNYSFAFVVMSATLALHLGMVWKVTRELLPVMRDTACACDT